MATTTKWASHADLSENAKHNGIELRFNAEPSFVLQSKLRSQGFRPSKVPFMWYADRSDETIHFGWAVVAAVPELPEGPDLYLLPCFDSSKTNIEKKEFSFVVISLKNGENKSYIIFEPSKPKAEVIATSFAQEQFPGEFQAVVIKPRIHIREARILFDEGKIIQGSPSARSKLANEKKSVNTPLSLNNVQKELSLVEDELKEKQLELEPLLEEDGTYEVHTENVGEEISDLLKRKSILENQVHSRDTLSTPIADSYIVDHSVFSKSQKSKRKTLHSINEEIEALIKYNDKEKKEYTDEQKNFIAQYTGSGGLISQGATGRGILYEYYTSLSVVRKMWDLAYHHGYDGGAVLEPSVGTGNFLKYVPKGTEVTGFETNHFAARIAQILYPFATIHEQAFETNFFAGNVHLKDQFSDKRYSLVIGNPPYGEFSGKYAGMGEKKWTGCKQYEQYFTLRGLDLLKPGGLLIYILPSDFLQGESHLSTARKISGKCIGLDRFRLGDRVFKTTDINTDILVLKRK